MPSVTRKPCRLLAALSAFGLLAAAALLFPPRARAATLVRPKGRHIRVAVVLTEAATIIGFARAWEVFQDPYVPERGKTMDEQMPFELYTVGASRQPIRTSGGMEVLPDHTFADTSTPDVVVVGASG
jgi:transcriptional regulator GlxA family with amidase domain